MKLLAFECSAAAASVAFFEDGKLCGEYLCNIAQTHSQTLLPMAQSLLVTVGAAPGEIDEYAVSVGPGSFTGLRIGIAAVKGMAFAGAKPCIGVSTLEAMAYNLRGCDGVIVPVMDARCRQVYTALLLSEGERITRLTEDMAIPLAELQEMLAKQKKELWLVGDGAEMCYNHLLGKLPGLHLAPAERRFQRAASVGALALAGGGERTTAARLAPSYLRLPQAERERIKKQEEQR